MSTAPSTPTVSQSQQNTGGEYKSVTPHYVGEVDQMLTNGILLMNAGRHEDAISTYFKRLIAYYESQYAGSNRKVFSSCRQREAAHYLAQAARIDPQTKAVVVHSEYAMAHCLMGHALLELGHPEEARIAILKAAELAPENSEILIELGHIHRICKDFESALAAFERVEPAARKFPPIGFVYELIRGWRGMGRTLIEMNNLGKAHAYFRKCYRVDPQDRIVLAELDHIWSLQRKARERKARAR